MCPMESRDTSARSARDIAEKIWNVVDIQKNARKRYCELTKSTVA
jgi:hypothetical protein